LTSTFQDLLEDLFQPVGGVTFRRMFGGLGIYRQGIMFALVADEVLYMKGDEATIPAYEAEGCGPFVYAGTGRLVTMSYWRLPERLLDEPDEFRDWALAAITVAERSNTRKTLSGKSGKAKPASGRARRATRQ
jgi:DNA transformation protein and related proteins